MSNYTKSTDFASKDALLHGDPLKIVSGTEINDEFNNIQTANNTKANTNSPTLTGAPSAPTAGASVNSTQLATTAFVTTAVANYTSIVDAAILAAKNALNPVGTVYTSATSSTNPATLLGFGTWASFGAGRVMVGVDAGNTNFDVLGETGGSVDAVLVEHNHTLTDPGHVHGTRFDNTSGIDNDYYGAGSKHRGVNNGFDTGSAVTGITLASAGVSGVGKNLQPYITVYMWKRTA